MFLSSSQVRPQSHIHKGPKQPQYVSRPLPFFISAQNATLGSSLSTLDDNPYWKSPSNEFAFGFQPVQGRGDLFLLAIWFDKIPEKTIVWTANGGKPVQRGSKVELTSAGLLSLSSPNGTVNWKISQNGGGQAVSAAMLDTGNFVLTGNNFNVLWQSFENPTDTILPTQILGIGAKVVSRLTKDDYTPGMFLLILQEDRNLVLYPLTRLKRDYYHAYWLSNTVGNGSKLIFNQSGYIHLTLLNGSQVVPLTRGIPLLMGNYYQRATLDFDGVFRQYTYQKSSSSNQSWSSQWSLPQDICQANFEDVGSGVCGVYSYCKLEEGRPTCQCPPGYVYSDPKNTFGGCKPNFIPQTCDTDGLRVGVGYEMQEIPNTDWTSSQYEQYKNVPEDWCSNACLNDCLCAVSISRDDGGCWLKKHPVSSGKSNPSFTTTAFIKVGTTTSKFPPPGPIFGGDKKDKDKDKDKDKWFLLGSILLGTSGFLNLVCLFPCLFTFRTIRKKFKIMSDTNTFGVYLRSFTYHELEEATDGFKEELGQGSFSTVYKGSLRCVTGTFVAVKRLDKLVREIEKEFKAEVNAIGLTNHKNLVKLLGYCHEGSNRLLVYEYMRNGSLADILFGSSKPEWSLRVQIALGIARGLAYLHEDSNTQIIHCDVKPQNILLDDFFMAKISDFGLAKLLNTNQTQTNTGIRGTRGYVAPEWFKNMAVTTKVDVYSFGIMLLEIICCRKNAKAEVGVEEIDILSEWVYEHFMERDFHLLVANDEEAKNDGNRLERFLMVALWCIQEDPSLRPAMKKVTQMLEGAFLLLSSIC